MCAFAGADDRGVDVQFPWEDTPRRFHSAVVDIGPFWMDRTLVTNAAFSAYLLASHYQPRDGHNYLKHWQNNTYPAGHASQPVRYVSTQEAASFCEFHHKRLPHAHEWQLSCQGTDNRTYPWGDAMDGTRFPAPVRERTLPPSLPKVGSFPGGDSPFGVQDCVGLLWQITDQWEDAHSRTALLKGSSLFNPDLTGDFPALPQVGNWYFPPARKLTQHNKLLLMDESFDRAGTMGFRCVQDHPLSAPGPHHWHSATGL